AAAREQTQLIDELLRRLPEPQADALRLRFFGGLTFPEIAAAMDCGLTTAKNRVRAGLTTLAEWLGPSGEPWGCAAAGGERAARDEVGVQVGRRGEDA
ncbi:MAG: RNA polymerase sigma factor, partial [Pirellulaceae bacterium]